MRGYQHASGIRLISVPPNQACCQYAWCLACKELCPLGREGSVIGGHIVPVHAMAKQLPLSQDVLWTRQSPVVCDAGDWQCLYFGGMEKARLIDMPFPCQTKRRETAPALPLSSSLFDIEKACMSNNHCQSQASQQS